MLDAMMQDIRYAIRTLRRRRSFAAVAVTTIALGIGAATSMYSVVDGVLFRPLPYPDPDRLVAVMQTRPDWRADPVMADMWDRRGFSVPEIRDWQSAQRSFVEIGFWGSTNAIVAGGDAPDDVWLLTASASLLRVLGVRPTIGRNFLPTEDAVGGAAVALISYETWVTRYAGDSSVLGRTVHIDDAPYTVVGVLPRGLSLRRGRRNPAYWIPAGRDSAAASHRDWHDYTAIARLRDDVLLDRARDETQRLLVGTDDPAKHGSKVERWQADQTRTARTPLLILLGAVGLLLLIVCVNVAMLLLGEAGAREQEMRTRIAIGATRRRLVRQLLTESVVLSITGALLGALLAVWGTQGLVALAPAWLPGLSTVRVDGRVLAFALLAAASTGMLFGLIPAFTLSHSSTASVLGIGRGQSAGGRGTLQRFLVGIELALSMVLLVGAGLLARSLDKLTAVDPGFRSERLLLVDVSLPASRFASPAAIGQFYETALSRARALPGVSGVTLTTAAPFTGSSSSSGFEIEGRPLPPGQERVAERRVTSPDYFATLGIPLREGRVYTTADRAGDPPVVVVSATLANREWPNESSVGKRLLWTKEWRTIIGVVGDVKLNELSDEALELVYAPLAQLPEGTPAFLVRTHGDPATMAATIRGTLQQLAPAVAISRVDVMSEMIARSFAEERYRALLITAFGVIAAVLAAVGMYGVTARAVSQRMREMAIRLALGAPSSSVARLVLGSTLAGVAVGIVLGVPGALAATRLLSPFLYQVSAADPLTYMAILALLVLISLAASGIPARRAARAELVEVLRAE